MYLYCYEIITEFEDKISKLLYRFAFETVYNKDEVPTYGKDATIAQILLLLEEEPKEAYGQDNNGNTPLHWACCFGAPVEVVSALLTEWPEAAQEQGLHCQIPLHTACSNKAPVDVVSALLRVWPDAARQKDVSGNTPLDTACSKEAPVEVVSALLCEWPDATKEMNCQYEGNYNFPLHLACCNYAPVEPDAVKEENYNGNTPFQLVCVYETGYGKADVAVSQ
eukprot:4256700-Ditylum_brightwellii.AAC.1